jgi:DNA-binding transcriptional MerR regulator
MDKKNKQNKKTKPRRNMLGGNDWYDEKFICNFFKKEIKAKEFFNEQTYRISDKLISPRVLTHWQENGLVSDDRPNGKGWRKFSINEIIWIGCMTKLRKFGLDLNRIKLVREYLEQFSQDDKQSKFPILDYYMVCGLQEKIPICLIVFDNGEALIGSQRSIDVAKQFEFIKDDYISIDIMKMVTTITASQEIKIDYITHSLTKVEKEFHKAIKLEDIKSIKITVKEKEYKLDKEYILGSKKEMNTLINKINYGESKIVKISGKEIYKVIENKKIKK